MDQELGVLVLRFQSQLDLLPALGVFVAEDGHKCVLVCRVQIRKERMKDSIQKSLFE